jgi:hypothetical protein
MQLDPLLNQRVVFKIHGHDTIMDATILRFDANGYWIRGGTLAEFLSQSPVSEPSNDVRYIETNRIQWLQRYDAYQGKI